MSYKDLKDLSPEAALESSTESLPVSRCFHQIGLLNSLVYARTSGPPLEDDVTGRTEATLSDRASERERERDALGGFQSVDHLSPFGRDSSLISVLKERTNVFPDITILEKATSNNLTAIKYQICCINISWILN